MKWLIKKLENFLNKNEVRRYNFIVGQRCLYQGVFIESGIFGWITVTKDLYNKRTELSYKYKIPVKDIYISNTIKD